MGCTRVKLANVRRGAILKTARNIVFFWELYLYFCLAFLLWEFSLRCSCLLGWAANYPLGERLRACYGAGI